MANFPLPLSSLPLVLVAAFGFHPSLLATIPSPYLRKSTEWLSSSEGRSIADNVLTWQVENGSWPKNKDTASKPRGEISQSLEGTFDNGATTGEIQFLAKAASATGEIRYRNACLKGIDLILNSQYPTGGWPQRVPTGSTYSRHITFNDGTMVRILDLLRNISKREEFQFVDQERRSKAKVAFERGIECILKCQIIVDSKRTVWCAQHDELDYRPRPARAYELVSLSGAESAGILLLLMSLENPSPEIRQSIEGGSEWFDAARIHGLRVVRNSEDTVVEEDPNAGPIWARFYEIETNRPFFCGRDGVKKYRLSEIELERRKGYGWYSDSGKDVAREYQKWKRKWAN